MHLWQSPRRCAPWSAPPDEGGNCMPSESELALRGRRASLPTSQHASAHHSAVEQASQQGRLLASQEARLLLRRSINQSVTQPACQLCSDWGSQPACNGTFAGEIAPPLPCSIKGTQGQSREIAPPLPCSRYARRAQSGCARVHASRPPSGAMHAHNGLCRRRQGRRGAGMPRGFGGWRPPDEGGNQSHSIAIY